MLKDAERVPGHAGLCGGSAGGFLAMGFADDSVLGRGVRLLLAAVVLLFGGCAASSGTLIKDVWSDDARPAGARLGKTLVVALTPTPVVAIALEAEWARQLRARGIDAHTLEELLPHRPPEEPRVVALVRDGSFDTLIVSRLVDVKDVERDLSTYQVGVVDTSLYAAKTETKFWSVRADTFLLNPTGSRIEDYRQQRARDFVDAVMRAMSESGLL